MFFYSSRRRHTIWPRDWSSDVCSSDLWGITREEQDELAMQSHNNMAAAYEAGFFNDLMTPFRGLDRDNNMRPGSTMESLGKLRVAFGKHLGEEATMTAGNSTPLTDGDRKSVV